MNLAADPLCKPLVKTRDEKSKILIVVLDGVGYLEPQNNISLQLLKQAPMLSAQAFASGNAVNAAYTPNLAQLYLGSGFRTLKAHGTAVGLPSDDDMGNSEVGHNALGAGRIFEQGAKLVNGALESDRLFQSQAWNEVALRSEMRDGTNTLHLCGLLSDGNVHSHIDHLFALINGAKKGGVRKVRLHLLLDGRDVSPLSALDYVDKLELFLKNCNSNDFDCAVASGGGRTFVTMDRYESDWSMVERGYNAHILGEARAFPCIKTAIETYRAELHCFDQDLPPFVIALSSQEKAIGIVQDQDGFIFFNFRGDRAIEISKALSEADFFAFKRKHFPKIVYAGMMQYDGDLQLPKRFLVNPPVIKHTITELLSDAGVTQFACSETQKYGHVTYFWNGNRSGKFDPQKEHDVEIPSDLSSFDDRPWMKSAEIADQTILQMRENSFQVGRINFPNGDMVGHTGNFSATVVALSALDIAIGRLMRAAIATNTVLVVTADHGNADEMFERDKKTKVVARHASGKPKEKTSHTLAPVPFVLFNTEILGKKFILRQDLPNAGLANIAATVLELAGFEPPTFYEPSLVCELPI